MGYLNLMLPNAPSKPQRDQMVSDLLQFQRRFHCFAQVRPDRVVADLSSLSLEKAENAKSDLKGIIKMQLKCDPLEMTSDSLTPSRLPPTSETVLHTTTLRVDEKAGAGLDLLPDTGGMRVEQVCATPGQPGILAGDLIIKINEVRLAGDPDRVEQIFGTHFR